MYLASAPSRWEAGSPSQGGGEQGLRVGTMAPSGDRGSGGCLAARRPCPQAGVAWSSALTFALLWSLVLVILQATPPGFGSPQKMEIWHFSVHTLLALGYLESQFSLRSVRISRSPLLRFWSHLFSPSPRSGPWACGTMRATRLACWAAHHRGSPPPQGCAVAPWDALF